MGRKQIIVVLMVFVLGLTLGLLISNFVLTARVVEDVGENYTYTTAICNFDNGCIDVVVSCSDGKVVGLEPVSELVNLGEEWEDGRDKTGKFCE